jgi:hypothetical protein
MTAWESEEQLWCAQVPGQDVRVELWADPSGWACRVYYSGRLHRCTIYADVRDAHHDATCTLAIFGNRGPSGAHGSDE